MAGRGPRGCSFVLLLTGNLELALPFLLLHERDSHAGLSSVACRIINERSLATYKLVFACRWADISNATSVPLFRVRGFHNDRRVWC
jgi:hypothetical protein